jgi:hypothetical protein
MADPVRFTIYDGREMLHIEQTTDGARLSTRDGEIMVGERALRWLLDVSGPAVLHARAPRGARGGSEARREVVDRRRGDQHVAAGRPPPAARRAAAGVRT